MSAPLGLLFDLDDTLYAEEDFVRSGYRAVAEHVATATGVAAEVLFDLLWYDFRRLGRTGAFDRFLARFPETGHTVRELVGIYRRHPPQIALWPIAEAMLGQLSDAVPVAFVTDGQTEVQRAKYDALMLDRFSKTIVYCWALEKPKPDPTGFIAAAGALGVAPERCVIVGDDPYHDVAAAAEAGIACIRVRTGRAREIATPRRPARYAEIPDLSQLPPALRAFGITLP